MGFTRTIGYLAYLLGSFVVLNVGLVIYDRGNTPWGWLLILVAMTNLGVGLTRGVPALLS